MTAKSGVNCMRMLPLVSNRGCDLTMHQLCTKYCTTLFADLALHEKNDFAKGSKILLDLKIILLEPQK